MKDYTLEVKINGTTASFVFIFQVLLLLLFFNNFILSYLFYFFCFTPNLAKHITALFYVTIVCKHVCI